MAIGDAAVAAGMAIVNGATTPANTLDTEVNLTRDYVAGVKTSKQDKPPAGVSFARREPGSAHNIGFYTDPASTLFFRPDAAVAAYDRRVITQQELDIALDGIAPDLSGAVLKSGSTMTGQLLIPNATPATSGYVAAYINSDGRVSKGASSERFKKFISRILPPSLGNIFPDLHRFQMRTGDGSWRYGWIAERLAEHPDQQPFVVYDNEGRPESIDFIALLIAQNAQLHERVTALEA